MRLFLASHVRHPETWERLEKYVGGWKGKRIAYIPTAANADTLGWESWKLSETWNLVQGLEADTVTIQLEDYKDETVIDLVKGNDVVWFTGGYPGYLMYWVRRTGLDKRLPDILKQGTIYVGSSAGAMAASKTLDITEWYLGENEPGAGIIPGMGLIDFDIYPHFEEDKLMNIKQLYKGNKMYLIKDGEEIIVEDNQINVVGEERIIGSAN